MGNQHWWIPGGNNSFERFHKLQAYQEHSSALFFSSLLPGDQKAFPEVVQCHSFTCPGRSNSSEGKASVLLSAFLSLFLCLFFSKCSVFLLFFSPFSSHFPHLSSVNSSRLAPSSASFFAGAVMLLALMFPSGGRGHLGYTSTQIRELTNSCPGLMQCASEHLVSFLMRSIALKLPVHESCLW